MPRSSPPLSKRHFDAQIKKLATKEELKTLATKPQLDRVELSFSCKLSDHKEYTDIRLKALEERLNVKLDAIIELLDVRKDVERLKDEVRELKTRAAIA